MQKEVTLSATQFFTLNGNYISSCKNDYFHNKNWLMRCAANKQSHGVEYLIASLFEDKTTPEVFAKFSDILIDRIEILDHKSEILKRIVSINIKEVEFTEEEMSFLQKPFPIILICNNEKKISLCEFSTQEYRAYEALKFGKDITAIATDTQKHQLLILKYLKINNVKNVQVILIDQLHASIKNKKAPYCYFTCKNKFFTTQKENVLPKNSDIAEKTTSMKNNKSIKLS